MLKSLSTPIFLAVPVTVRMEMANPRQELLHFSPYSRLSLKVVWERYGEHGEL
jgi:hypothetical protein